MPEKSRIHYVNWFNSHLSIARHFGGIKYQGKEYVFDHKSCEECVKYLKEQGEYKEDESKYFPDLIEV